MPCEFYIPQYEKLLLFLAVDHSRSTIWNPIRGVKESNCNSKAPSEICARKIVNKNFLNRGRPQKCWEIQQQAYDELMMRQTNRTKSKKLNEMTL